jgi:outer membrane translocation and assembly module TamA
VPPSPSPPAASPTPPAASPAPPAASPAPPAASPAPPAASPSPPAASLAPAAPEDRAAAEERCAGRDPSCDWLATLSSLERASVARALIARGYEPDPAPWGKVIGAIRIYNEEVFAEPNAFLQFFNYFHITTRESAVRAEAVVAPGQVWDQKRIDETARLIRDPLWTSVVAVIPVKASAPGSVDVLIVTRDIWSLRFNTQYTYQQGKLTNLTTSLSENNFLGQRDLLSAALTMDQGAIAVGPLFIDKNLLGEHFNLQARVDDILTRDDLTKHSRLHSEGSDSTITLTRPLWNLASEWAAGAQFTHRFAISRQFSGTQLRQFLYVDPVTMQGTKFPIEYELRQWSFNTFVTRQWGDELKQQLSIGHGVTSVRPTLLDDFAGDDMQRAAFIAGVLPRSEVTSVPFLEYSFFTPRYRALRNVSTFDLAEDLRTGPDLDISIGFGLKLLGSDHNFQRLSSAVGWTFPWAREGFVRVAAGLGGRYQADVISPKRDSGFIDDTVTVSARGATPPISGVFRLLAQSSLSMRLHDTQNLNYAIGSDSGLRGYDINEFIGKRYFNLQVEARTLPYPIWVLRVGGVVFYDLGGAAPVLPELGLHQDAGVGLRILIPQTSAQLLKFDLAVPFDGRNRGALHFLAGFGSEF